MYITALDFYKENSRATSTTMMQILSNTTGIGMVIAVAIAVATWVLNWVWVAPKRAERFLTKQGLCGTSYRLWHGDLKETKAMRLQQATHSSKPCLLKTHISHDYFQRVRPFLHRSINYYGKNCLMWEGPVAMVNIGEAELMREVFSRYIDFLKPTANPIASQIVRGLVVYEGHKWALHRKLLNPAFHLHKLKRMLPAFYMSCSEMVKLWEDKVSMSENEIDVFSYLTNLSADVISRAAFGSSFEEGKRIFQLIREQLLVASEISQSVYFPGLRFMPTKSNKKMKAIEKEIKALLTGIIEKRKEGKEIKDDLLGLLMESNSGNEDDNKRIVKITTQEMVDECKLFYVAGQETTSSLLTWTLILLSQHHEWQSRAREEVINAFGLKKPDFEGLNHLKTMNIIFHEVMRLYPPVIELRRTVAEDNTKLGELTLPKGTLINLPLLYVQQDPQVWGDDAKEFNPERFSEGISKASKGSVSFVAFGWGPRICIGSNFAMLEAKLTLSMILQRFRFEVSPAYVHAPVSHGILHPQFGAPLIFHCL